MLFITGCVFLCMLLSVCNTPKKTNLGQTKIQSYGLMISVSYDS